MAIGFRRESKIDLFRHDCSCKVGASRRSLPIAEDDCIFVPILNVNRLRPDEFLRATQKNWQRNKMVACFLIDERRNPVGVLYPRSNLASLYIVISVGQFPWFRSGASALAVASPPPVLPHPKQS